MADNPTISVDITVMLEKLQTELRRAEEMVAQSAGRINASLGMGGGVGGAGVPGVTAATAAASAGAAAPMPPSSFVPSAAGARVGMMGGSGGFAAGAAASAGLSRFGSAAMRRFVGPTAIIGTTLAAGGAIGQTLQDELMGQNEQGFGRTLAGRFESMLQLGGIGPMLGMWNRGYRDELRARGELQRRATESERRRPIADALRDEIGALDFGRRMSEMERVGDTRGMEQMIIRRTVTETLQQADTLRAAGISPEMIDRRNEAIARSLAEELGGATGGVDEFATAAGMFRTGAASAERTNEILNEIQGMMRQMTETLESAVLREAIQSGGMTVVGSVG